MQRTTISFVLALLFAGVIMPSQAAAAQTTPDTLVSMGLLAII